MKLFTNKIFKRISLLTLSLLIIFVAVLGVYDYLIPDSLSYFEGESLPVFMYAEAVSLKSIEGDKNCAEYRLFDFLPIKTVELSAYKETKLIPGGMPFGVKFFTDGIMVSGFCDVDTPNGKENPAVFSLFYKM